MQLEYDLTPETYLYYNLYFARVDPARRRKKLNYCFGFGLLGFGVGLILTSLGMLWMPILLPIITVCVAFFSWDSQVRQNTKKLVEEGRSSGRFGPHTLSIGPEGIITSSEVTQSSIKWKAVQKITKMDTGVFIFLSSSSAILLPDSAFDSQNTREDFMEEALRYREIHSDVL